MAGINVLSDIPKGGNKLDNIATQKGKETSDNFGSAASAFAAILDSRLSLRSNPKGQSSLADQDSEDQLSNANPGQDDQNPNGLENLLGYCNSVLPFLTQRMLQSELPAGKEANSGDGISQVDENSLLAKSGLINMLGEVGKNLEAAILNQASLTSNEGLASTGMVALSSQGNNLGITELDKYREIIANLLVALSGEITDSTPKGNLLGLNSKETIPFSLEMAQIIQGWMTATDEGEEMNNLRQEVAKIAQAWMTMTDDVVESDLIDSSQKGIQRLIENLAVGSSGSNSGSPEQNAKTANLLAALYPGGLEGNEGTKEPKAKEALVNQLKGIEDDLEAILTPQKELAQQVKGQQKFEISSLPESKLLNNNSPGASKEDVDQVNSIKSSDLLGSKDAQTQPSGGGIAANVVSLTGVDGKLSAIPLWGQISTVVREQVINNRQHALKELDIQLHPAELGNIRVFLRWENGQVHLQVHASEAATGQLLQNQLQDLRQTLVSQGVDCGSLEMGQSEEGQQQSHNEAEKTFQRSNILANEDEDIPITDPNALGQDGISRINVTA